MALFQAIDRNTQQAFANRSQVQQLELQAGLKVSQMLEEQRMNELRASAVRQSMSIQAQKFAAEKKLLPLLEKRKMMEAERQLIDEAKKSAAPEFAPLNSAILEEVRQNPQLASGIRGIYDTEFKAALNSNDPDLAASVPKIRDAVSRYVAEQKMAMEDRKPVVDKATAMEAAFFAQSLGGNGNDILYTHDPEFKQKVDAAFNFAKLTGKVDAKVVDAFPIQLREQLNATLENQSKLKMLDDTEKDLFDQYKTYKDASGLSGPVGESARAKLEQIGTELQGITDQRMKLRGIASDKTGGEAALPDSVKAAMGAFEGASAFGQRPDGTSKGLGFLGGRSLPDGGIATEYTTQSDDVQVNGQRIDFPTLVPTLTDEEVKTMTQDIIPNNKKIPEPIMRKAIDHAKKRIAEGKSVFYDPTQGELPNSSQQQYLDESVEVKRKVSAASPVVEQLISGDKKQWDRIKQTMEQNPSLLYDEERASKIIGELVNPTERQILEIAKDPEFSKVISDGTVTFGQSEVGGIEAVNLLRNESLSNDAKKRVINVLKRQLPELVLRYIQAR